MKKRIRILHVAPQPPPMGGMVTYIQGLLGSDVFLDIDYKVVRLNYFNKELFKGLIRLLLNIVNAFVLSIVFIVKTIFWNPDIVHIQANSGFGFFEKSWISLLAHILGKKTLFHFHGGNLRNYYLESSRNKQNLIRRLANINDRILTGSPQMRENWLFIGIQNEKIVYIGNAVNLPSIVKKQPHETINILFLTRIIIEKGIIELIDAYLTAQQKISNLRLIIVGAESLDTPYVKDYLKNKDKEHIIQFIGYVSDEGKHDEYSNADIFAFPTYVEDQSYAILEAMSYGLPCIASNVGGVPSLIRDGENGLLVSPRDVLSLTEAIVRLSLDSDLRTRLGENARKTIENGFTWKKRSPEIIRIYRDTLGI